MWVMHRRGGNAEKKGLTIHYRCRYCCVDFCGAGPQTIRTHFQVQANSTVRVITLSTQNCAQAGSQSTRPLPHMNLNVSERLICALWGLSQSTDRVTG